MYVVKDLCQGSFWLRSEIVSHRLLLFVPIFFEDSVIVSENLTRNVFYVGHDLATNVVGGIIISSYSLLTILSQSSHLRHIILIQDVKGFWYIVHRGFLGQAGCVRVTN